VGTKGCWATDTPESVGFDSRVLDALGGAVRNDRLRSLHGVVVGVTFEDDPVTRAGDLRRGCGREHPRVPLQWAAAPRGGSSGIYTRLAA
jgi:hypothetical protein